MKSVARNISLSCVCVCVSRSEQKYDQDPRKKEQTGIEMGFIHAFKEGTISDAETHVDIFRQELVGSLVLLQDVVVDTATGEGAAHEEAEETTKKWVC